MPKRKVMIFSDFYCTSCGNKGIPLARNKGHQYGSAHLKKIFCCHCGKETNHVEVKPFEPQVYDDFLFKFKMGRFVDGNLTPVRQLTPCKEDCEFSVNGKCWNSNHSNTSCTKERN